MSLVRSHHIANPPSRTLSGDTRSILSQNWANNWENGGFFFLSAWSLPPVDPALTVRPRGTILDRTSSSSPSQTPHRRALWNHSLPPNHQSWNPRDLHSREMWLDGPVVFCGTESILIKQRYIQPYVAAYPAILMYHRGVDPSDIDAGGEDVWYSVVLGDSFCKTRKRPGFILTPCHLTAQRACCVLPVPRHVA